MQTTTDNGVMKYRCEECGFHYTDKKWAERCEEWCKEHHTCNIGITNQAEESHVEESLKSTHKSL